MRESGFTIIELLIASALLGIIMVFTMEVFTVNNRAYTQIDAVVETQQSLRVVAGVFERDLRHAGFLVPEGAGLCAIDNDDESDLVYISDFTAIDTGTTTVAYTGARVQGAVSNVTTGVQTLTVSSTIIETGTPDPSYDNDGNGTNETDFRVGGGAIIIDRNDTNRGSACGVVTAVDVGANQLTIDVKTGALAAVTGAVQLIVVPALEYRVTGTELYRNGRLLADGVEDLQVSFYFDLNGDNLIDAGEVRGDGTGADYVASSNNAEALREVRFNMVLRSRRPDDQFNEGHFQALENRDPVAGRDGFRRRAYTSTVRLRNIGSRVAGS